MSAKLENAIQPGTSPAVDILAGETFKFGEGLSRLLNNAISPTFKNAYQSEAVNVQDDPTYAALLKSDPHERNTRHVISHPVVRGIRGETYAEGFYKSNGYEAGNEAARIQLSDALEVKSSNPKHQRQYSQDIAAEQPAVLQLVNNAKLPQYPQGVDPTKLAYNDRLPAPSRMRAVGEVKTFAQDLALSA